MQSTSNVIYIKLQAAKVDLITASDSPYLPVKSSSICLADNSKVINNKFNTVNIS